jgi:hypothetical protein
MFDSSTVGIFAIFSLVCGLIVVVVALIFFGLYRNTQKDKAAVDQGLPATAKVLKVGQSETSRNYGTVTVNLALEVTPPSGVPYTLKQVWDVDPASIANIQEGRVLAIKVDARDPKRIYSTEPWARSLNVNIDYLFDDESS